MDQQSGLVFELALFWGAVSLAILVFAWRSNFFKIGFETKENIVVKFKHVIIAFLIYLITVIFITPLILKFLHIYPSSYSPLIYVSLSNIISFVLTLAFLSIYYMKNRSLLETNIHLRTPHFRKDLKVALTAWLIATPIVLLFSQVFELIIISFSKEEKVPEQLAVSYLKMTLESPIYFGLAILSIVVLAPIIEEVLFRGFLQTWLKRHLGVIGGIIVSSLCFAFFHFSVSQKIGNLAIIGSLFPLAFFLGFIYEKQKTLISPICLHAIFNLSSVLSLIFLGSS